MVNTVNTKQTINPINYFKVSEGLANILRLIGLRKN